VYLYEKLAWSHRAWGKDKQSKEVGSTHVSVHKHSATTQANRHVWRARLGQPCRNKSIDASEFCPSADHDSPMKIRNLFGRAAAKPGQAPGCRGAASAHVHVLRGSLDIPFFTGWYLHDLSHLPSWRSASLPSILATTPARRICMRSSSLLRNCWRATALLHKPHMLPPPAASAYCSSLFTATDFVWSELGRLAGLRGAPLTCNIVACFGGLRALHILYFSSADKTSAGARPAPVYWDIFWFPPLDVELPTSIIELLCNCDLAQKDDSIGFIVQARIPWWSN
jgi:hypothetical protein